MSFLLVPKLVTLNDLEWRKFLSSSAIG